MKCPKCGYLGFEPVERCRNCGYDFSLLQAIDLPELPIREQGVGGRQSARRSGAARCRDVDGAVAAVARGGARSRSRDRRIWVAAGRRSAAVRRAGGRRRAADHEGVPPRPPLAVRRATPEVIRPRSMQVRAPLLDLGSADPGAAARSTPQAAPHPGEGPAGADREVAGLFARLTAGAIDLIILAAIDLVVIYFTMQICGLELADLRILPKGPLVAFLLAQNLGYLVVFTAGGQTLGKMAADIRVVSAGSNASLDLSRSTVRTLVWLVLAVPAGLGFLTALFSHDRRGLHDRCAGARVVRASI